MTTLVVAPTRELAIQTHETLLALGKPFQIASVAVFGGVPKEPQVRMLKNANKAKDGMTTRIIVGTPGRILDLMQEGACDLSEYVQRYIGWNPSHVYPGSTTSSSTRRTECSTRGSRTTFATSSRPRSLRLSGKP